VGDAWVEGVGDDKNWPGWQKRASSGIQVEKQRKGVEERLGGLTAKFLGVGPKIHRNDRRRPLPIGTGLYEGRKCLINDWLERVESLLAVVKQLQGIVRESWLGWSLGWEERQKGRELPW
jgi:hypothetical protein